MITLALARGVYFVALRLPFTHSEDAIQAIPRGWLLGSIDLRDNLGRRHFSGRLSLGLARLALALRPGGGASPRGG